MREFPPYFVPRQIVKNVFIPSVCQRTRAYLVLQAHRRRRLVWRPRQDPTIIDRVISQWRVTSRSQMWRPLRIAVSTRQHLHQSLPKTSYVIVFRQILIGKICGLECLFWWTCWWNGLVMVAASQRLDTATGRGVAGCRQFVGRCKHFPQ